MLYIVSGLHFYADSKTEGLLGGSAPALFSATPLECELTPLNVGATLFNQSINQSINQS